jgi:hypothetical protein
MRWCSSAKGGAIAIFRHSKRLLKRRRDACTCNCHLSYKSLSTIPSVLPRSGFSLIMRCSSSVTVKWGRSRVGDDMRRSYRSRASVVAVMTKTRSYVGLDQRHLYSGYTIVIRYPSLIQFKLNTALDSPASPLTLRTARCPTR